MMFAAPSISAHIPVLCTLSFNRSVASFFPRFAQLAVLIYKKQFVALHSSLTISCKEDVKNMSEININLLAARLQDSGILLSKI